MAVLSDVLAKIFPASGVSEITYKPSAFFDGWDPDNPKIKEIILKIPVIDPFATMFQGTIPKIEFRLLREEEKVLFVAMNWTKKKLLEEAVKYKRRKTQYMAHRIVKLYDEVLSFENAIVNANLGLVLKFFFEEIYQRRTNYNWRDNDKVSFQRLLSDANDALLRAAKGFRIDTGNKFSTYASVAIIKGLRKSVVKKKEDTIAHFSCDGEWTHIIEKDFRRTHSDDLESIVQQDEITRLMTILRNNDAGLTDNEKFVLEKRILVEKKENLEDIGFMLSLSKERIRQIETKALSKLRRRLELNDYRYHEALIAERQVELINIGLRYKRGLKELQKMNRKN